MIVHAATMNGISTASESPKTASRTASAIGSAIASPFSRSSSKIGSRSPWIAGVPLTNVSAPPGAPTASRTSSVRSFASVRSSGEPIVPKTTVRPAVWSGCARPPSSTAAPRTSPACSSRRVAASPESSTRKTTRNEPSSRWPNRCSRVARTSSESVPGTVNSFESSLLRSALSAPPVRRIAIQTPTTSQRCRSTSLVHRSFSACFGALNGRRCRARRRAALRRLTRPTLRTAANQT